MEGRQATSFDDAWPAYFRLLTARRAVPGVAGFSHEPLSALDTDLLFSLFVCRHGMIIARDMKKPKDTHFLEPVFKTLESARINRSILSGKGWECSEIIEGHLKDGTPTYFFQAKKFFKIGERYAQSVEEPEPKELKEEPWEKQADEYAKEHSDEEGEENDAVRLED
jgi:hypothetical protein